MSLEKMNLQIRIAELETELKTVKGQRDSSNRKIEELTDELAKGHPVVAAHADAVAKDAGWQPIETAPKDATEILAITEAGLMVVFWADGLWREKAQYLGLRRNPTYWMHLPAAPDAAMAASREGQNASA